MSIVRTALPLVLLASVLTGCAGLQKTDWPKCAAVGGVGGAALGAIESSSWAGWGALVGGTMAAAYCYVHGDGDEDGDGVPDSRDKCPGTPRGVQVDANGCPPEPVPVAVVEEVVVVKEETIVIRDIHFEFDSAKLTAADKSRLNTIATRLKQEAPSARLSVTGHTDSVGSDAYNQKLSERRAHSVTEYLIETGVPRASFVSVRGAGESQPEADNRTADGRAQNRRTEIRIER
ncbi:MULTISPECIES: OmpA family protein [unclassified Pseudomonas]|uniref:OmpA family protein n=1 Tax=unclassified Pseudomonas TaxID=196821 RepID=UPI000BA2BC29|nr:MULTISPECIES: OmpA family protein [unclassified Pseudomonas]MCU1732102.1 OmpA family protein [Pseudomonas sp. 20P_3.2_Bac4]MCU1744771.1 OmpA family protein [Pseudomonas sp. 20P_3.2_Bac5]